MAATPARLKKATSATQCSAVVESETTCVRVFGRLNGAPGKNAPTTDQEIQAAARYRVHGGTNRPLGKIQRKVMEKIRAITCSSPTGIVHAGRAATSASGVVRLKSA